MDFQKLILVGNVTRDPERKKSKDGKIEYTTFRVGVGDSKRRTIFFPITAFAKLAEQVSEYVSKGRQVLVEGRLEQSQSGRMSVVANRVVFGSQRRSGKSENDTIGGHQKARAVADDLKDQG